ncbi:MAG TPA: Gfo/Idh/MocA family oxidoreductase [Chloroflexota bacterium]|nr:Gfo/Idh/MocA family oxidoreductase [Chloroflexota bacterium]
MTTYKIAGINFDHQHMGDNLRMAHEHPEVEIVGICDENPARMEAAVRDFGIPPSRVFTDYRECLERTQPNLVLLCPATAEHAAWVERVAPFGTHILVEKPFAASLAEADRMIAAMQPTGKLIAINWPLAWYPPHVTSKRLIDEGVIGEVREVHYYDGNRGPLWHTADKIATAPTPEQKAASWFYNPDKGGGSLLDYLGYGVTLGAWFHGGATPLEVTTVVDVPGGLSVDEHSITIARYPRGLSKFETRWGAFTDPWAHQPQPKCGFVIVGAEGTVSSYDYEPTVRVQTGAHPEGMVLPVDELRPPHQNPIQYMLHCIKTGEPIRGPLSVETSRVGQRIVDSALQSARERRTVRLG